MRRSLLLAPLVGLLLAGPLPAPAAAQSGGSVLVYSRTTGFRHASIPQGIAAIRALGQEQGFTVTATESPGAFTPEGLAAHDAVVFLNTTGDVLDGAQQDAFEAYVRGGGGFLGIHSAADTEYDWPFYGELVGAYFQSHPPGTPTATVHVVDRVHPAMDGLPITWERTDEWYNYRSNPRGDVHVLATLDEQTFTGGSMLGDHPIAWCRDVDNGRSFYTGGGHTGASFSEPAFREHLSGALGWAAGWLPGDCSATVESSWERTVLENDVRDPMELAVAPDGRVLFVERAGRVRVWSPTTGSTSVAATVPVTTSFEDGLLGITLDPGFAANGWVYLYYSRPSAPEQRLSRFTMTGDVLDLASEAVLLTVTTDRTTGGHSGGSITFGPDGLLYVATGDDVDPFASDGYAPIDEQPGRSGFDAQFTSANPFNLLGKVLRLRPMPDGSVEIPDGNLFPADGSQGRPEIYAMGARNPFRISVDPATGWLYWGDVGPDAGSDSGTRGPRGYDEFNQARQAGFFGWPYCIADNRPYRDYDFATGSAGPAFDCAAAVNDSPHVPQAPFTLPPAQPAWAYYPYAPSPEFPDLPNGNGRTAMAGPTVRAATPGGAALPAYFDGATFFYEWSRNWIVETHLDADGGPLAFQRFLPSLGLNRPMDLELGPDGALYMIEWGSGFGGSNPDAALSRIAYVRGTRAPIVALQASETDGPAPLTVQFSSDGTRHPDGLALDYAWDFDDDGQTDATTPEAEWTYTENGSYLARLTVEDSAGLTATTNTTITVGNSRPVVQVGLPPDGGFFAWGDSLRYDISVTDVEDGSTEDGSIDCADVVLQPGIGHDDHNHPLEEYAGCDGGVRTPDGHGSDADNVFLVLDARYVDGGALGVGSLIGRRQTILRPLRLQAEHFTEMRGIQVETAGDVAGGLNVGFIDDRDWLAYAPVSLQGLGFVSYRVASAGPGGRIEMRLDAPDGPLVSTATVTPTGGWQDYKDVTVPLALPDGVPADGSHTLYLVFRRTTGRSGLMNLNWIQMHGPGVAVAAAPARGLLAEYYASADLSGTPVRRTDPQVSFDWLDGAPLDGVPADGFSVRWQGQLDVPAAGRYRFTLDADDGARLYIGSTLVVDAWAGEGPQRLTGSITLAEGLVPIRVEYREASGEARVTLLWSASGLPQQTLPYDRLLADATGSTAGEAAPAARFALAPPRPNPSSGAATVAFRTAAPGEVTLSLFDTLGRRVQRVHDGPLPAGPHELTADVSGLPSGVYVLRLSAGDEAAARRLTVVR